MPSFDIAHRLTLYGYKGEPQDFFDIMAQVWYTEPYAEPKHRNTEQLMYNPIDALQYCAEVRARAQVPAPDHEILQTLNNLRKNQFLNMFKGQVTVS